MPTTPLLEPGASLGYGCHCPADTAWEGAYKGVNLGVRFYFSDTPVEPHVSEQKHHILPTGKGTPFRGSEDLYEHTECIPDGDKFIVFKFLRREP